MIFKNIPNISNIHKVLNTLCRRTVQEVCSCMYATRTTPCMRLNIEDKSNDRGANFKMKVKDVLQECITTFSHANISEPRESSEHIIAHILKTKKISDVYKARNTLISPADARRIHRMREMRLAHMPIQYIIQEWDFCDLTLKMLPPVFIPRPETEMLVDMISKKIKERKIKHVLDLCCGSGAIGLALLKSNPKLEVISIDMSEAACKLTKLNAERNGLSGRINVIQTEIKERSRLPIINNSFNLVVCNPPYVPSRDMLKLQPEIALYEDPAALDGGEAGLNLIKIICAACSRILKPEGTLFMEVDASHPGIIQNWLAQSKELRLNFVKMYKDFCDKNRFVELIKSK